METRPPPPVVFIVALDSPNTNPYPGVYPPITWFRCLYFLRSISEGTQSFIFLFFFIISNSRPSSFVYLGDIVCKIIILRINKQEEKHLMTYLCKRSWWLIVCPFTCCSPYGKLSGLLLEVAGYIYWSLAEGQKGGKRLFNLKWKELERKILGQQKINNKSRKKCSNHIILIRSSKYGKIDYCSSHAFDCLFDSFSFKSSDLFILQKYISRLSISIYIVFGLNFHPPPTSHLVGFVLKISFRYLVFFWVECHFPYLSFYTGKIELSQTRNRILRSNVIHQKNSVIY